MSPEQLDAALAELRRVTRRNFWIELSKMTALMVSMIIYFWWVL
jgi:hypothetical protein